MDGGENLHFEVPSVGVSRTIQGPVLLSRKQDGEAADNARNGGPLGKLRNCGKGKKEFWERSFNFYQALPGQTSCIRLGCILCVQLPGSREGWGRGRGRVQMVYFQIVALSVCMQPGQTEQLVYTSEENCQEFITLLSCMLSLYLLH